MSCKKTFKTKSLQKALNSVDRVSKFYGKQMYLYICEECDGMYHLTSQSPSFKFERRSKARRRKKLNARLPIEAWENEGGALHSSE